MPAEGTREAARPGGRLPRKRGVADLALLAILVALWVLLWGNLSVANLLSGLAVAFLVVKVFPLPPLAIRPKLRPLGVARFLWHFLIDMVRSTVEVAWQVLRIGRQPRNAVIAVTLRSPSDLLMTLTAIAVSLVPGSVVIEARQSTSTLFVHILGAPTAAAVERARHGVLAVEARLIRALGSDEELQLLDKAQAAETPAHHDTTREAGT